MRRTDIPEANAPPRRMVSSNKCQRLVPHLSRNAGLFACYEDFDFGGASSTTIARMHNCCNPLQHDDEIIIDDNHASS